MTRAIYLGSVADALSASTAADRPGPSPTRHAEGHRRALRVLDGLFWTAVVVSIVHYTDNYVAFERYPQLEGGPNPTPAVIVIAFAVFTAFGLVGYLAYRRGSIVFASACLVVYSLSGLIGIGHYSVPGMSELAWWRHAHIVGDILCGVAILAFAFWSVRWARRRPSHA